MTYRQLNIEEREALQVMKWEKRSIRYMARVLRRDPSTVSRELERNSTTMYIPRKAQERADTRIQERGHRPRLKDARVRRYVERTLKRRWSPEQIAGRMHIAHSDWPLVSPEAIYQFIYADISINANASGNDLRRYLRRHHRIRKKKGVHHGNRGSIVGKISIEQRPKEVDTRETFGHWEGDSMVSRQSLARLNSLVERKSGLLKLSKIENGSSAATATVVIRRLKQVPQPLRQTMTVDNGHEHADHLNVTEKLGMAIFFCHVYCSSERGTNENTNGLVREYFPKKTNFTLVSRADVVRVERALNCRPRKRLNYLTPLEVFNQGVALEG